MAVTYGFYNAINHDRLYDAIQVSSIFDGVIHDGVYMNIGDRFMVTALSEFSVLVGTGRAWFDHTWTLNDAPFYLDVNRPEVAAARIDTVVLEVNEERRENEIKIIKGIPSLSPVPPTLINNDTIHQHPLADIRVNSNINNISQANITNRVGTSDCPFVTGVVQSMNIDSLVAQWTAEWGEWNVDRSLEYDLFKDMMRFEFETWFSTIRYILDGDVAGKLANRIAALENRWRILARDHEVRTTIIDSNDDTIKDSNGLDINGNVIFVTKE